VQRLTAFAFNYYDGAANPNPQEQPARGFFEKSYGFAKLPNLLTYLGWMYMPAVFPMGPFVEFRHFENIVEKKVVPRTSPTVPALKCMITAVVCLGINQIGAGWNITNLRDAKFLEAHSPIENYFYILLSAFFLRFSYYFGFKIAEGAAVLSGLGYGGLDAEGNDKWDASCGVDILGFELATSYQMASASWNIQTSAWLKRYVYFRAPRGNAALYSTYAVSAFWHGFYPGYYIFFFTIACMQVIHRKILVLISPLFKSWTKVYYVLSLIATIGTINYFVASFIILDAGMTLRLFTSMYWFQHWGALVVYILLTLWENSIKKQKTESEVKTK